MSAGASLTNSGFKSHPKAVLFGCAGPTLSADEARFFADSDPLGFILFKRNCEDSQQVADLTAALRASVGRQDAPILIDEEGGRVQRLGPPNWPDFPAAEKFGALSEKTPELAEALVRRAARAQASQLSLMGFSANAAPVLDLRYPGASAVVGERAYSGDPDIVSRLGSAVIDGLLTGGIIPVIKHMPGHGRAQVDSHVGLPAIDADLATLDGSDFAPFLALRDCPWGMVGHLLISAVDDRLPASCSAKVIQDVIRGRLSFEGLLLSDDLSMGALSGSVGERAAAALDAGCDVAVHCNGVMAEMEQVADKVGEFTSRAADRLAASLTTLAGRQAESPAKLDVAREVEEIVQALASA